MPGRSPTNSHFLLLGKEKLYGKQKQRVASEPTQKDESKKPVCPVGFTKPEREMWQKYADILDEYGMLNMANGQILDLLVRNLVDRNKCAKHVKTEGICIPTARGLMHNPYFTAKNKLEELIMKYLNLLGLSGTGLAKLGCLEANSKEKKSEMETMMD